MNLLPKFPKLGQQNNKTNDADDEKALLQYEAKTGGQLFGPLPKGHYRDFFCLDYYTWIWYEEWPDQNGKRQSVTTKYVLQPSNVLKSQNGHPYQRLSRDEANNLYKAVGLYRQQVGTVYQQLLQAA